MARLLGSSTAEVQSDRVGAARSLAERTGAVVVLKGYRSLVCTPAGSVAVNPTGNAGMASGGTGDVLTGLIAALVGQGLEPAEAARAGVFLHGEAGDLAAAELGEVALIASDLIERLPAAMCRFAP
jgi:NAD(P)H-hydrate epimerase